MICKTICKETTMGKKGEYKNVQLAYIKMVSAVMEHIYPQNEHPRLVDYEQAVAEYKNKHELVFAGAVTKRDVHTQVYRAVKQLEKMGELIHVGRYYYPADIYNFRIGVEDFKKNVQLAKGTLATISGTTYAIALESGQNAEQVKKSVLKFLRDINVFNLVFIDNTLIIIMNDITTVEYITELRSCIELAYKYQQQKKANIST